MTYTRLFTLLRDIALSVEVPCVDDSIDQLKRYFPLLPPATFQTGDSKHSGAETNARRYLEFLPARSRRSGGPSRQCQIVAAWRSVHGHVGTDFGRFVALSPVCERFLDNSSEL